MLASPPAKASRTPSRSNSMTAPPGPVPPTRTTVPAGTATAAPRAAGDEDEANAKPRRGWWKR